MSTERMKGPLTQPLSGSQFSPVPSGSWPQVADNTCLLTKGEILFHDPTDHKGAF